MDNHSDALAIYIHWPYCTRICPYCDFNVYKARNDETLTKAIAQDLTAWRAMTGTRTVTSVHFGGGTPSLMQPDDIGELIQHIDRLWGLPKSAEIAIEANPGDAKAVNWQSLARVGVNRLSLGVQSFYDPALKLLGRDHSGAQSRAALDLAMDIFPSVSLDLIFGWAGQTQNQWADDLTITINSGASHISTYQLTIETGTAFAKAEARGQSRASGEGESADFYDYAASALGAAKYRHYEVSNFAKPGHESRHNLAYWQGLDYVGVGPGAHGRITQDGIRRATIAHMRPDVYAQSTLETGSGIAEDERLSPEEWGEEYALMGLRIEDGISLSRHKAITQRALPQSRIDEFVQSGHLIVKNDRLMATYQGRLVLNHITEVLLTA